MRTSQAYLPRIPWGIFPRFPLETTYLVFGQTSHRNVPGGAVSTLPADSNVIHCPVSSACNIFQGNTRKSPAYNLLPYGKLPVAWFGTRAENLHHPKSGRVHNVPSGSFSLGQWQCFFGVSLWKSSPVTGNQSAATIPSWRSPARSDAQKKSSMKSRCFPRYSVLCLLVFFPCNM